MSTEENKGLVRRFIDEILERKRRLTFPQISEIRKRVWSDGQGCRAAAKEIRDAYS